MNRGAGFGFESVSERSPRTVAKIIAKNIIIENSINPMAVILSAPSTDCWQKRFRFYFAAVLVVTAEPDEPLP
jgi:hypothetical protein